MSSAVVIIYTSIIEDCDKVTSIPILNAPKNRVPIKERRQILHGVQNDVCSVYRIRESHRYNILFSSSGASTRVATTKIFSPFFGGQPQGFAPTQIHSPFLLFLKRATTRVCPYAGTFIISLLFSSLLFI
jgi:hypothetical protein